MDEILCEIEHDSAAFELDDFLFGDSPCNSIAAIIDNNADHCACTPLIDILADDLKELRMSSRVTEYHTDESVPGTPEYCTDFSSTTDADYSDCETDDIGFSLSPEFIDRICESLDTTCSSSLELSLLDDLLTQ